MTHPGEQFYPQGVHWDVSFRAHAAGSVVAAHASSERVRQSIPVIPISFAGLEALVETAASASCAPATARIIRVALFLGNTPDHPVNFFGALKPAPASCISARSTARSRCRQAFGIPRARARHQQFRRAVATR